MKRKFPIQYTIPAACDVAPVEVSNTRTRAAHPSAHPSFTGDCMKQTTIGIAPERMPVILGDKMSAAQKQAAAAIAAGPRGALKGPFVALLRSPDFMDRVQRVGEYVRYRCPLDKRVNELAAAITARHWT